MLFSRTKITEDGRVVGKTRDAEKWGLFRSGGSVGENHNPDTPEKTGTEQEMKEAVKRFNGYLSEGEKKYYRIKYFARKIQDSITEGAKVVINTENHVNETAIIAKVDNDSCLVRFENGEEETIPIESISAFESMANDKCMKDISAPKDFFDLDEWKIKAKELGYSIENNSQRGLWVAKIGIREMGTYNPTKGGRLYVDQATETETKINELKHNMDAARARGYDTSAYVKEIKRLKSKDATKEEAQAMANRIGEKVLLFSNGEIAAVNSDKAKELKGLQYIIIVPKVSQDKYTGDPLTAKGQEIMASLKEQYGEEKGEQVFYAMKNSGQIEGIDSEDGGPGSGVKGHTTPGNEPAGGRTSYKENFRSKIARKREELIKQRTESVKKSGGVLTHEIEYIIKPTLAAIKKGVDPHKAFASAAENENYHGDREDIKADRQRIINYLSKKHRVRLDPSKIDKML